MKQPITAQENNENELQVKFLLQVKKEVRAEVSFTDELADLLAVSKNSAYRRIKGETAMSIAELITVSKHYGVPFSTHAIFSNGMVMFNYPVLSEKEENFKTYLTVILETLKEVNSTDKKQLLVAASDIPPFHYFCYPALTLFKIFYHKRAILDDEYLSNKLFDPNLIDADLLQLCQQIYDEFIKIPSVEVWHHTTIDSTLEQIAYYWDSGVFSKKEDVLLILDQLSALFENLKQMADRDSKLISVEENNFMLYESDISLGNTTFNIHVNEQKIAFLRFNTFNSLNTTNLAFCNEVEAWLKSVIKKATKISGTSEKQRNKYFKLMHEKIKRLIERINQEE
jgi:hypothetical protein